MSDAFLISNLQKRPSFSDYSLCVPGILCGISQSNLTKPSSGFSINIAYNDKMRQRLDLSPWKDHITELYINQGRTLKEVLADLQSHPELLALKYVHLRPFHSVDVTLQPPIVLEWLSSIMNL